MGDWTGVIDGEEDEAGEVVERGRRIQSWGGYRSGGGKSRQ